MVTPPLASNKADAKTALVLASGGLDSATVLAIAKSQGYQISALSFRYGQRHEIELQRAKELAKEYAQAGFLELELPLGQIGGSSLVGDGEIPSEGPKGAGSGEIPSTYVPARNMIFLSLATAVAEAQGIRDIFLGVNAMDYSGYPDCRPEFVDAFAKMANLGTKLGVSGEESYFRYHSPLMKMTKAEIIQRGSALGVDYSQTSSCYNPGPSGGACARCESCGLRKRGFEQAGISDPTIYE